MTTKKQLTFGILIAFAAVLSLGITTTPTYAQQNGKACPTGFELNKGQCEAAPTITEIPGVPCPTNLGGIVVIQVNPTLCRSVGTPTGGFGTTCDEVGGTLIPIGGGGSICEFTTQGPQVIESCDVGVLNEASGLCEVKPGNRAK